MTSRGQWMMVSMFSKVRFDHDHVRHNGCLFSGLCKDGHLTPGGGAIEIELARQVSQWAETHPGLEQYSINKFAEALEIIPRVLAENSGVKPKEVISKLYAAHSEGNKNMGFDIDGESGEIKA